jgi:GDP-L-fucose synthase
MTSERQGGAPEPGFWAGRSVVVTGGGGFLGRPTVEMLTAVGADVRAPRSADFDLRERGAASEALAGAEVVLHLAANVGGIGYNRRNPGPLLRDNVAMGLNVFEAAREHDVEKLVAAGSVCAYPLAPPRIPFVEDDIHRGEPEPSNAPYGNAKRVLIELSAAYREQYGLDSCVPVITNLYGPGDDFDPEDSHVIPAMIGKYLAAVESEAPEVSLWGSGEPTREFLYVDDAARALLLAAERLSTSQPVNIGIGEETRIRDLAERIAELTGFEGKTVWDHSRPDGQPRRVLDVDRARELIGFEAELPLEQGLPRTIESRRAELAAPGRETATAG